MLKPYVNHVRIYGCDNGACIFIQAKPETMDESEDIPPDLIKKVAEGLSKNFENLGVCRSANEFMGKPERIKNRPETMGQTDRQFDKMCQKWDAKLDAVLKPKQTIKWRRYDSLTTYCDERKYYTIKGGLVNPMLMVSYSGGVSAMRDKDIISKKKALGFMFLSADYKKGPNDATELRTLYFKQP